MSKYADVPEAFQHLFKTADEFVSRYFKKRKEIPQKGTIEIDEERYILIRASSMSVELFNVVRHLFEEENHTVSFDIVKNLLFDIAHAIGKSDAAFFHEKCNLSDPVEKLSAGPIHFAFTGWASVHILPESCVAPDDTFCLIYDHPYSFESDSWIKSKLTPDFPVCIMNAGYSSGWCEESFGIDLFATEISCRARNDSQCRFIMAPPHKIQSQLQKLNQGRKFKKEIKTYSIPGFFKRKEIEYRLRKSEEQYKTLFENANDAIFILEEQKISQVNSLGIQMLKTVKQDIIGKTPLHFSPQSQTNNEKSQEVWKKEYAEVLTGTPSIFEWRFTKPDGTYITTEISLKLVENEPSVCLAICRDISQRKQFEAHLIQVQKLEAVGTMASGVAHDFNNILSGMLGFTSLLKSNLPKSDNNLRYLNRIEDAVQKAAALTKQLLTFSQAGKIQTISLNINNHIKNTLAIITRTFDKNIEVDTQLNSKLKPIVGDPSQIEQLIMNLCLNASKAMPDGGTLSIQTFQASKEQLEKDLTQKQYKEISSLDMVCLEISDDGIGMNSKALGHIFEPYYSLRANGTGCGLGMLIVYNVVQSHNGQIVINSKPDEGTKIRVYFPSTDKAVAASVPERHNLQVGNETILIADDEDIITDFLDELLTSLGYSTIIAHDGQSAIQKFRDNSEKIDLAILNVGMPKLGGKEVFDQLHAEYPDFKVILTSGLPFSDKIKQTLHQICVKGFLKKPFKPEELCQLIRTILDG